MFILSQEPFISYNCLLDSNRIRMLSDVTSSTLTVLCVDDNPSFTEVSVLSIERADDDIDCVLSEYDMPDVGGLSIYFRNISGWGA